MVKTEWQNEQSARRHARYLYSVPFFCRRSDTNTPCVIDGETDDTDMHHLDECGKKSKDGWFFENLVPICHRENDEIERSRQAKDPPQFPKLASLSAYSETHYNAGNLPHAYACARLGSFLAWSQGRRGWRTRQAADEPPSDRNQTVLLAAHSLRYLRGIDPGYAVPLAADTLDRSILPHLDDPPSKSSLLDTTRFSLAMAAGTFHRDYHDDWAAVRYFDLADRYSDRVEGHRFTPEYAALINNKRILEIGLSELGQSDQQKIEELRSVLHKNTRYTDTRHGMLNDKQWHLKWLLWNGDPEEVLHEIKEVEKEYFKSGSFTSVDSKTKNNVRIHAWMRLEYLAMDADARERKGDIKAAEEISKMALRDYREGRLAPNPVAQPRVLEKLFKERPNDFGFPFRNRASLGRICRRTSGRRVLCFQDLSKEVIEKLEAYEKARPKRVIV
jgi:hypothetical protein